jgi:hypothetical protein
VKGYPAKVRRCPHCTGPAYFRQETYRQYRVVQYGCSKCELAIEYDDAPEPTRSERGMNLHPR